MSSISIKGSSSSSQAGPSTLSPPLHRTSSSPNPTIHFSSSTSRLLPRPKLPSPSHSSTEPSTTHTRPSKPITTRSLGPSSAARRPTSLHSSNLNPTQPRPRLASSGSAHLPTSVSLNNLEPPPPPGSENGSRRGSPKPNHRPSASAGSNTFLDATPLPSPSIFAASNAGSRRSSFLGSTSGEGSTYAEGAGAGQQVGLGAGGGKTLYRAGFQPKGVWRARTGEFVEVRMRREEGRRGEERRLGRRLEKLIELHFSPIKAPIVPPPPPIAPPRRSSSAFSLDFESLKNPGDLWRGLKERSVSTSSGLGGGGGTAESKRAAEQGIVKWEEDSTVKKCPICTSSFNLANRKHHCRLCGRVVCALPATPSSEMLARIVPSVSRPLARAYSSAAPSATHVATTVRTFKNPTYGSGLIPMFGESSIKESDIPFQTSEWSRDLAAIKGHAPAAADLWRKITMYIAIPGCIACGIYVWKKEGEHLAHLEHEADLNGGFAPKTVQYEYLNMRKRPFPWSGNQSLFHNDKFNQRASEEFGGE